MEFPYYWIIIAAVTLVIVTCFLYCCIRAMCAPRTLSVQSGDSSINPAVTTPTRSTNTAREEAPRQRSGPPSRPPAPIAVSPPPRVARPPTTRTTPHRRLDPPQVYPHDDPVIILIPRGRLNQMISPSRAPLRRGPVVHRPQEVSQPRVHRGGPLRPPQDRPSYQNPTVAAYGNPAGLPTYDSATTSGARRPFSARRGDVERQPIVPNEVVNIDEPPPPYREFDG